MRHVWLWRHHAQGAKVEAQAAPVARGRLLAIVIALCVTVLPTIALTAQASLTTMTADVVLGQSNFSSASCYASSTTRTSASSLCYPDQAVTDQAGNLWVADSGNNRVLMFPYNATTRKLATTASVVLGQYGSFTTYGCNQPPPSGSNFPPAPSAYSLCSPTGLAIDGHGNLYVSDTGNNRVLVYLNAAKKSSHGAANLVLGQSTFSLRGENDTPAGTSGAYTCAAPDPASACTLDWPAALSIDPAGDLLVPDQNNNRVLLWSASTLAAFPAGSCASSCFIPASESWGQYGSMTTNSFHAPLPTSSTGPCTAAMGASACNLWWPEDAIVDSHGDLFIADTYDMRVLEYDGALSDGRQDATMVYGQQGDFTTLNINPGGVSATTLYGPAGLAFDRSGHLWVSDALNNRVLEYPSPSSSDPVTSATAIAVLGQGGDFTTSDSNANGVGPGTLYGPTGLTSIRGALLVADTSNSRVLGFGP